MCGWTVFVLFFRILWLELMHMHLKTIYKMIWFVIRHTYIKILSGTVFYYYILLLVIESKNIQNIPNLFQVDNFINDDITSIFEWIIISDDKIEEKMWSVSL